MPEQPAATILQELALKFIESHADMSGFLKLTGSIHDPLMAVYVQLNKRKNAFGDELYHTTKHLSQLSNVIMRLASGIYKIDSKIGTSLASDFINQSDRITKDLAQSLNTLTDEMLPTAVKADGITVDVLKKRLAYLAHELEVSGLREAGIAALEALNPQESR